MTFPAGQKVLFLGREHNSRALRAIQASGERAVEIVKVEEDRTILQLREEHVLITRAELEFLQRRATASAA